MVNVEQLAGQQYLNVDYVKKAKDKRLVIIGEGEIIKNKWGVDKLELPINIDTKSMLWTLNGESVRNLMTEWGKNTVAWVGKVVNLDVDEANGQEYIIAMPKTDK